MALGNLINGLRKRKSSSDIPPTPQSQQFLITPQSPTTRPTDENANTMGSSLSGLFGRRSGGSNLPKYAIKSQVYLRENMSGAGTAFFPILVTIEDAKRRRNGKWKYKVSYMNQKPKRRQMLVKGDGNEWYAENILYLHKDPHGRDLTLKEEGRQSSSSGQWSRPENNSAWPLDKWGEKIIGAVTAI